MIKLLSVIFTFLSLIPLHAEIAEDDIVQPYPDYWSTKVPYVSAPNQCGVLSCGSTPLPTTKPVQFESLATGQGLAGQVCLVKPPPAPAPFSFLALQTYDFVPHDLDGTKTGAQIVKQFCQGVKPGHALAYIQYGQATPITNEDLALNHYMKYTSTCTVGNPGLINHHVDSLYLSGDIEYQHMITWKKLSSIHVFRDPAAGTPTRNKIYNYYLTAPATAVIAAKRLKAFDLKINHSYWHERQHFAHFTGEMVAWSEIANKAATVVPTNILLPPGKTPESFAQACIQKVLYLADQKVHERFQACTKDFHAAEDKQGSVKLKLLGCACGGVTQMLPDGSAPSINQINAVCDSTNGALPEDFPCDYSDVVYDVLHTQCDPNTMGFGN